MVKICIVGAACRLPGAPDEAAFRDVLNHGSFTVGALPADRWNPELLFHPDPRTAGAAYTFAGGFLRDPFDFDIGVFGMSPREAMQVDPQQRLLAEVVWEALEDARIPATSLAGQEVGVYVGASALDHANMFGGDPGAIESHFMTGNTLSIVANRISYLFDLKGPSFVVDTACSASLVAVDRAMADLRSGRIDTAIVGGVNMLLSPASFVGFSRASMLSKTGTCRPFSANADGYVRSEGAVVFVLRREDVAVPGSIRAVLAGSAVNSDGRTSGIALPGLAGQRSLLGRAYADAGIDPEQLAFVEAHGTGTVVGDPIEAIALSDVLGRPRSRPLPIGSVKSNIGHLEPASGVAGMMKALIAMEQRSLPPTLHLDELNPDIAFAKLNLAPAATSIALGDGELHCGVSSFGFGGTNAHVVMTSAPAITLPTRSTTDTLVLSAYCKDALAELAKSCADRIDSGIAPAELAGAMLHGRASLRRRAVMAIDDPAKMASELRAFSRGAKTGSVYSGTAFSTPPSICFVYNGNGSQWVGMGRAAYAANPVFASAFDEVDEAFQALGLDCLVDLMHADNLTDRLGSASVAQPLIFATQVGVTAALAANGLRPASVLGHSVGEIAAAHAAGILDLSQSVRILVARALSQETVRGAGLMAALSASRTAILGMIEEAGLADVWVAAENAPSLVTVSGSRDAVSSLLREARKRRIPGRMLDVDYPYHSPLLDEIRRSFLAEAGILTARQPTIPMISTVTGQHVEDRRLETPYWWQNMRAEVRFRQAVRTAAEHGANLFIEIGPRPILASALAGSIEDTGLTGRVLQSLAEADVADFDPIGATFARALAHGFVPPLREPVPAAAVDRTIDLPRYPWQRTTHRYCPSTSALDIHGNKPRHPLIGARIASGTPEWRTVLDAQLVPYLADHMLGGEIVVPATALAEMALAVARELWPVGGIRLEDFDIVQAMVLPADGQREISVRYGEISASVEIYSRPRFGGDDWTLCAQGHIAPAAANQGQPPKAGFGVMSTANPEGIYRRASASGIDYGPTFRLLENLRRGDEDVIEVTLASADPKIGHFGIPHILHPAVLDAAFHGLFDLLDEEARDGKAWLPIRFDRLAVWKDQAQVVAAIIVVDKSNDHLKTVTLWLKDADGAIVARLDRALLRAVVLSAKAEPRRLLHLSSQAAGLAPDGAALLDAIAAHFEHRGIADPSDGSLLLRAHMRASVYETLRGRWEKDGVLDIASLADRAQTVPQGRGYLAALLGELEAAGLLHEDGGKVRLPIEARLPDPDAILATFAAEYPEAATDLALSAHAAMLLPQTLADWNTPLARQGLLDRHGSASLSLRRATDAVVGCLDELIDASHNRDIHVVVAERHGAALIGALAERAAGNKLRLSVAVEDANAAERLWRRLPPSAEVEIIDLSASQIAAADVIVVVCGSPAGGLPPALVSALSSLLHPGGVMLAVELGEDGLATFQRGLDTGDAAIASHNADLTIDAILAAEAMLADHRHWGAPGAGMLIHAASRAGAAASEPHRAPALCSIDTSADSDTSLPSLIAALARDGIDCFVLGGAAKVPFPRPGQDILYILEASENADALAVALSALRQFFAAPSASQGKCAVRIVAWASTAQSAPYVAALRAFVRVAMNEAVDLDIRFIEIAAGVAIDAAASGLARLMAEPGAEREFSISPVGLSVPRIMPGLPLARIPGNAAPAIGLRFPRPGVLENFEWTETERSVPGPGEIEVEVIATGLNFRDIMLAMGLLNDDVLDEGLAGAVYGLECAGRVTVVGTGANQHRPGDLVVGFGMNSFASHVVAMEGSFIALPAGLPAHVAAGIPVAFCTAWYALVELARLKTGERMLVHGGAGGVGLAAIQIASAIGAEVIATVSSPDKEAIARLYGATHVYDSRSLGFVDAIRDNHDGVDVVLNSLAGDAMRGSVKCLRARGRFIELGKRDYVANSQLGLRPFRRNLSYFGVDLDQLLEDDPATVGRGLKAIAAGFSDGTYLPLPTMAFRAFEIGEAFRLMQSSGHVGKIVIAPPPLETVASTATAAFSPGEKVQLIVGGTQGFGLETALWLARQGAATVVVASRSGRLDPARAADVDALRERGITFAVERVDVTSPAQVDALIARIVATHGPIGGVYHTAAHLDDGLIENLSERMLADVLAPKVSGAENLDKATRSQPIEQFVLFSSASALIGNPGQSAYAAANGYLEGLARRRRSEGLPAIAVAWGAISDVGLLAGQAQTLDSLRRVAGVAGMLASDALDELGRILPLAARLADPVVTCAEFANGGAIHTLAVPSSPAFASHFAARGVATIEGGVSIAELIADKSDGEAHKLIAKLVVEEVAQILRLAVKDIDLDASIDTLGMDSLMALELRMSIETKHAIELPVLAISAAGTLRELAHRILLTLRQADQSAPTGPVSAVEDALIGMHGGEAGTSEIAASKRTSGSGH